MPQKRILIIHPCDRTTSFLRRIRNHLESTIGNEIHYFSVKPNDGSHDTCLERIKEHPENGAIIFLGHGRSDKLYGGKAEKYKALISDEARAESPEEYYYNENFINEGNIEVFNGKKVFCLSCNSNKELADFAIEKGAVTFLGFGDIPTSQGEFLEDGKNVSNDLINRMKGELNYIIKKSLSYCIKNQLTFLDLFNTIQFVTNQTISSILIESSSFKQRFNLVNYLYFFKNEMKIKGDKMAKLLE